jgi:drug/metabolite transporter (DMT)-like permease
MLSVLFAVLASVANAAASVLQRKGARRLRGNEAAGLAMVWRLTHELPWLGGIGAMLCGFVLQAAALATGPIAQVQPVLVLELGFTLVLSSLVFRSRLGWREWSSVLGMSVGLALLLVGLSPKGGDTRSVPAFGWIIGSAITLALVGALVLAGHRYHNARRAEYLGIATGVMFGYTAVLVAGMTAAYADGFVGVFEAWQTYAIIVVGPAGFFLLQQALRAGRLVASQPGMTLADPLVAIAWGVVVFGEQPRSGGWVAADVAGAGLIAVFTVVLARSPLLHDDHGEEEESPERPAPVRSRGQ